MPNENHHHDTFVTRNRGQYPHRNPQRSLGAAEGVLVALGQCSLDDAFAEIVSAAKRNNVAAIELANALVAIVEGAKTDSVHADVLIAATEAWGGLVAEPNRQSHGPFGPDRAARASSRTEVHRRPSDSSTVRDVDAIPRGDEADLIEQSAEPDGTDRFGVTDDGLVGGREADAADLIEQNMTAYDDRYDSSDEE